MLAIKNQHQIMRLRDCMRNARRRRFGDPDIARLFRHYVVIVSGQAGWPVEIDENQPVIAVPVYPVRDTQCLIAMIDDFGRDGHDARIRGFDLHSAVPESGGLASRELFEHRVVALIEIQREVE